jgi:hypothetical protein
MKCKFTSSQLNEVKISYFYLLLPRYAAEVYTTIVQCAVGLSARDF